MGKKLWNDDPSELFKDIGKSYIGSEIALKSTDEKLDKLNKNLENQNLKIEELKKTNKKLKEEELKENKKNREIDNKNKKIILINQLLTTEHGKKTLKKRYEKEIKKIKNEISSTNFSETIEEYGVYISEVKRIYYDLFPILNYQEKLKNYFYEEKDLFNNYIIEDLEKSFLNKLKVERKKIKNSNFIKEFSEEKKTFIKRKKLKIKNEQEKIDLNDKINKEINKYSLKKIITIFLKFVSLGILGTFINSNNENIIVFISLLILIWIIIDFILIIKNYIKKIKIKLNYGNKK